MLVTKFAEKAFSKAYTFCIYGWLALLETVRVFRWMESRVGDVNKQYKFACCLGGPHNKGGEAARLNIDLHS